MEWLPTLSIATWLESIASTRAKKPVMGAVCGKNAAGMRRKGGVSGVDGAEWWVEESGYW